MTTFLEILCPCCVRKKEKPAQKPVQKDAAELKATKEQAGSKEGKALKTPVAKSVTKPSSKITIKQKTPRKSKEDARKRKSTSGHRVIRKSPENVRTPRGSKESQEGRKKSKEKQQKSSDEKSREKLQLSSEEKKTAAKKDKDDSGSEAVDYWLLVVDLPDDPKRIGQEIAARNSSEVLLSVHRTDGNYSSAPSSIQPTERTSMLSVEQLKMNVVPARQPHRMAVGVQPTQYWPVSKQSHGMAERPVGIQPTQILPITDRFHGVTDRSLPLLKKSSQLPPISSTDSKASLQIPPTAQDDESRISAMRPPWQGEVEPSTTSQIGKSQTIEVKTTTTTQEQCLEEQVPSGGSPKNNSAYF